MKAFQTRSKGVIRGGDYFANLTGSRFQVSTPYTSHANGITFYPPDGEVGLADASQRPAYCGGH